MKTLDIMKRAALATAVSIATSSAVLAESYQAEAYASTLNAIVISAGSPTVQYYVDNAAGTASNKSGTGLDAEVPLFKSGGWTFDFTNPAAVTFTGNLQMGDYKTQVIVGAPTQSDARQTFYGVVHSFSGVGTYDEGTNIFSYTKLAGTANSGGGSVYSADSAATCANGQTSFLSNICDGFAASSRDWEGLSIQFIFSEDRSSFGGYFQGIDKFQTVGGSATITWAVSSVPVPAAAWLFGSGLIGMAGAAAHRRRRDIAA
jgi:hypothetical protein